MRKFILTLLVLASLAGLAQNRRRLDSLLQVEKTSGKDSLAIKNLLRIAISYKKLKNIDSSVIYTYKAVRLANELNLVRFYFQAHFDKCMMVKALGNFRQLDDSLQQINRDPRLAEDPRWQLTFYQELGVNYRRLSNFDKSVYYMLEAIKAAKATKHKRGLYNAYNSLANTYSQAGLVKRTKVDLERALENYREASKHVEPNDSNVLASLLNNQGVTYFHIGEITKDTAATNKCIYFYLRSLDYKIPLHDSEGIASAYDNLGSGYHSLYLMTKKLTYLDETEKYYKKALQLGERLKSTSLYTSYQNYAGCLNSRAQLSRDKKTFLEAIALHMKALRLSTENGDKYSQLISLEGLAKTNVEIKMNDSAVKYFQLYNTLHDTILNAENRQIAEDLAIKYESDLKDSENKNLKEQAELREEVISKKSATINIMIIGSVILLGLIVLVFISRQMINQQRKESEQQKKIIEQKNKEITDSINYAKRLQNAILTTDKTMRSVFSDSFVLYKPKDIVSGDFYWMFHVEDKKVNKDLFILTAADCTGHGVPGAFMSMLNSTLLNQTAYNPNINTPADALNFLNRELPKNLRSSNENENINDGMDIAFCLIDINNNTMKFAGANNPCWVIRNNELIELKPLKQAITAATGYDKKDFVDQEIKLQKGDLVYLFTDGYADQFGGPKGKKFKYRTLSELLLNIYQKPCAEQGAILEDTFNKWKGALEQVDDVLIVGVKI